MKRPISEKTRVVIKYFPPIRVPFVSSIYIFWYLISAFCFGNLRLSLIIDFGVFKMQMMHFICKSLLRKTEVLLRELLTIRLDVLQTYFDWQLEQSSSSEEYSSSVGWVLVTQIAHFTMSQELLPVKPCQLNFDKLRFSFIKLECFEFWKIK